ncbi:hypothetical protein F5148DRAFT_925068 [Russula earlei]|uniref:Uncharacterized protein n=1 Tax=Russula earlei TaxID=71964 RepID=A0ACC0TSM9_9AGAM|nr:hypothetical protein F5148DRAFT_925068 [Russula earlei]
MAQAATTSPPAIILASTGYLFSRLSKPLFVTCQFQLAFFYRCMRRATGLPRDVHPFPLHTRWYNPLTRYLDGKKRMCDYCALNCARPNGPTNATPSQPPSSCQHMPRDCDHLRACVLPTTDAHEGEWSSPTPLPHLHHPALNACCAVARALSTNRHTTRRPNGPAQRHSLAVSITPGRGARSRSPLRTRSPEKKAHPKMKAERSRPMPLTARCSGFQVLFFHFPFFFFLLSFSFVFFCLCL